MNSKLAMPSTNAATETQTTPSSGLLARCQSWSSNDWLTLSYLLGLTLTWLISAPGPLRDRAGPQLLALVATFVGVVLIYARGHWGDPQWRALAYRLGHFGCIELSYFVLGSLLPAANPGSLDVWLYELDLRWFGVEPAMYFDRFVTPFSTEWFAFFYYSYYLVLLSHIVPIVFFSKHVERVAQFALGITLVTTLGQTCYLFVPGFGPFHAMPELFSQPLPDGFWWSRVKGLVEAGGAQKDIFPSLHTALPTYILLFCLQHRKLSPYKQAWPLLAFFVVNIVISTMFLRWHYLIDVIAGLILASGAHWLSGLVVPWESERRRRLGLGPIWPQLRKSE